MGQLHYGDGDRVFEFEDRLLQHLKLVIVSKLRRGESFLFSWDDPSDGVSEALWLHPAIALRFSIATSAQADVNRKWVEVLSVQANSAAGLTVIAEPEASAG